MAEKIKVFLTLNGERVGSVEELKNKIATSETMSYRKMIIRIMPLDIFQIDRIKHVASIGVPASNRFKLVSNLVWSDEEKSMVLHDMIEKVFRVSGNKLSHNQIAVIDRLLVNVEEYFEVVK